MCRVSPRRTRAFCFGKRPQNHCARARPFGSPAPPSRIRRLRNSLRSNSARLISEFGSAALAAHKGLDQVGGSGYGSGRKVICSFHCGLPSFHTSFPLVGPRVIYIDGNCLTAVLSSKTSTGQSIQSCVQQTIRSHPSGSWLCTRKFLLLYSNSIRTCSHLRAWESRQRFPSQSGKSVRMLSMRNPSSRLTMPKR